MGGWEPRLSCQATMTRNLSRAGHLELAHTTVVGRYTTPSTNQESGSSFERVLPHKLITKQASFPS